MVLAQEPAWSNACKHTLLGIWFHNTGQGIQNAFLGFGIQNTFLGFAVHWIHQIDQWIWQVQHVCVCMLAQRPLRAAVLCPNLLRLKTGYGLAKRRFALVF